MKELFGIVCLVLGSVSVGVQLWLLLHPPKHSAQLKAAAEKVSQAAKQVKDAADQVNEGVTKLHEARRNAAPDSVADTAAADAQKSVDAAKAAAGEADQAAQSAGNSLGDVVNTLAGKLPVGVLGLLFVLAGAWIEGYISLTVSAAAK